jgi:alpha-beta hydrolase superfamily lysophospholipase
MKNAFIRRLSLLLVLFALASLAHAQTPAAPSTPAGYWNVETNLTTRDQTIVRFYNDHDQLVYEETLPNFFLNMARRGPRHRATARLNQALEQVLRDPSAGQTNTLLAHLLAPNQRIKRGAYAAR